METFQPPLEDEVENLSCTVKSEVPDSEDEEAMYFDASNSVKVEMNADAEDKDLVPIKVEMNLDAEDNDLDPIKEEMSSDAQDNDLDPIKVEINSNAEDNDFVPIKVEMKLDVEDNDLDPIKIEKDSDAEDNDSDPSEMEGDNGEMFAGSSLMQFRNCNSKDKEKTEDPLAVAKKNRSPKKKMWLQIYIVWLSTEQARDSYTSELEQQNLPDNSEVCHQCRRSFKRKEDLTLHAVAYHGVWGAAFECDICEYRFTMPIHLHRHVREHYLLYKCKTCDYETRYLHQMKIHTNNHEVAIQDRRRRSKKIVFPTGYPHRCNKCKNFFGTKSQLQEHSKKHGCYPASSICDMCLKLFKNRDKYMHRCTYKETECADCHQKFKTVYFKRLHNCPVKVNMEREQLHCTDCDKEFKSRKSYQQHIAISRKHVSPEERFWYQCPHCEKKFSTRPNLQRHILEIHLRRKPLENADCPA